MGYQLLCNIKYRLKTIYQFDYRVREDLLILIYSNKKSKRIISKKEFKLINQENLEIISEKVIEYSNRLDDSEKELFNKNINIDKLLDINQNNINIKYNYDNLGNLLTKIKKI